MGAAADRVRYLRGDCGPCGHLLASVVDGLVGTVIRALSQVLGIDILHHGLLEKVVLAWTDHCLWRDPWCRRRRAWCSEALPPPQTVRPGLASSSPGLQACLARGRFPRRWGAIACHLSVGCCSVVVCRIREVQRGVRCIPVTRMEADPAEVIMR